MAKRPWQFNELSSIAKDFLDPAKVMLYDHKQRANPQAERELLTQLGLSETHTFIEFGSGTGTLALEAARVASHCFAIDVSPAMTHHGQTQARDLGLKNVSFIRDGLLTYEHNGPLADVVVCKNTLHHLPDFWKVLALRRVASLLKPGGIFYLKDIVYSFDINDAHTAIEHWINSVATPENCGWEAGWSHSELEHHVREEFSTYTWLLEQMLEKTGFFIQEKSQSELQTYASYHCVKR